MTKKTGMLLGLLLCLCSSIIFAQQANKKATTAQQEQVQIQKLSAELKQANLIRYKRIHLDNSKNALVKIYKEILNPLVSQVSSLEAEGVVVSLLDYKNIKGGVYEYLTGSHKTVYINDADLKFQSQSYMFQNQKYLLIIITKKAYSDSKALLIGKALAQQYSNYTSY